MNDEHKALCIKKLQVEVRRKTGALKSLATERVGTN